ncbi:MAG: class I SAM-dependent methyltransferase [Verrucomicrobia bacterium]|nr:class I SAM-dependent methyltransferase [Verrucomicrobiota bacterium]
MQIVKTTSSPPAPATLRLRVTTAAEQQLRAGHPWLFATSVREQNREGLCGELAVIYDRNDRFLAVGLFDPESPLRVRILHAGKPAKLHDAWWRARLQSALARRENLFAPDTTGFRWIYGESDGWPGLVLDRYDTTLVLKLYTAAWLPRLSEVTSLIQNALHPLRLVLRLSRNIQEIAAKEFSCADGQILLGPPIVEPVVFLENGLRFEADVLCGQKTGFFLDQRENRREVESHARGREVLNTFSFSGGFSLYAARGGAVSVTDLDISAYALESARRNFALNAAAPNMAQCRHETEQTDVFEWLAKKSGRKFDLIVLDPPSLAKRETERAAAIQAYGRLAEQAIARLRAGGILVASSCSAHVSAEEFFAAVQQAAARTHRNFAELRRAGHPADHPVGFKEAEYLKCIFLKF